MDDSLTQYFKEVRKYPMLTKEQEQVSTPEQLVLGNLKLVVSVAKSFQGRGLPFGDLIQAGNEGLIHASKKYQKNRARFSTYAVWWIRANISRAIKRDKTVHISDEDSDQIDKLWKYRESMPPEEVLKFFPKEKQSILDKISQKVVSLSTPIGEDSELGDLIPDEKEGPEELFEIVDKPAVLKMLEILPKRHREILTCRYGLLDNRYKTLKETGEIFGCSKQNVQVIEQRSLKTLRKMAK